MRFLFTCGGTAGHINPAVAVANRIKTLMPDSEFLFVGAEGKMETELVPREGYEIKTIRISSLQRKISVSGISHNLRTMRNLITSRSKAKAIISEFNPNCAIGTGGYVCYPVLRTASKMGIPTAVHESNAVPGLTTKMLEKFVSKVMVGFEGVENEYKNKEKVIFTGTPVKEEFFSLNREKARAELGINGSAPVVVSFWGSLGASGMNAKMEDFIRLNSEGNAFYHIHATGGGDKGFMAFMDKLSEKGVKVNKDIDIRPYIFDMPKVMAAADIILCRAGASTLNELVAMGKPSVLVPSPYVTNNHQEENARVLERVGGAKLFRESECTGEELFDYVRELSEDKAKQKKMSESLESIKSPYATDKIVEIILNLLKS